MADDPARQAYLARLRTKEGIRDFGVNYFQTRGSDPFRNRFSKLALERAENELPLLTDIYDVHDPNLEGKLGEYFSGAWNPTGRDILSERDRLGGLEGSIFATGDADRDQAMWQGATMLGRADQGANWANAYGTIEQRRAGEFNSMLAQKAASGNPWEGFFSGWRMGLPQMAGTIDSSAPGGGASAPPATTPPATTPPLATTPPPATTPTPTPTTPPPATTPTPTTPTPTTPTPTTPPGTPAATSLLSTLQSYGATVDAAGNIRGNPLWSTEGYNSGGVQNPLMFQYANMSGQGRNTRRGDPVGVWAYRVAQLMNQRKRGGNRALGLLSTTTDDQIAQMALQFVNKNLRDAGRTHSLNLVNGRPVVTM